MKFKKREICPLCSSNEIQLYKKGTIKTEQIKTENFNITDSQYGSLWNFFMCRDCSFVFSNPYVPEEDIFKIYTQLEDKEYNLEAAGRAKNFKTILKRLATLEKPGNKLLDIGAASGIFLHHAREWGYECEGIEPSEFLVKEAKKHYNLDLHCGTLDTLNPQKKYSVITLLDILEHLVEPSQFSKKMDTLLEPEGIVVIVTPDINSFTVKMAGNRWWHYRVAHVNFFNINSLSYLLEKFGFKIVKKKRYSWNFSLFYLISRIFPAIKNKKTLQRALKRLHLKLQLFDSWEIYARKS